MAMSWYSQMNFNMYLLADNILSMHHSRGVFYAGLRSCRWGVGVSRSPTSVIFNFLRLQINNSNREQRHANTLQWLDAEHAFYFTKRVSIAWFVCPRKHRCKALALSSERLVCSRRWHFSNESHLLRHFGKSMSGRWCILSWLGRLVDPIIPMHCHHVVTVEVHFSTLTPSSSCCGILGSVCLDMNVAWMELANMSTRLHPYAHALPRCGAGEFFLCSSECGSSLFDNKIPQELQP